MENILNSIYNFLKDSKINIDVDNGNTNVAVKNEVVDLQLTIRDGKETNQEKERYDRIIESSDN